MYKRGEIVLVNFEPTQGKELQKDRRPALIISNNGINDNLEIYTVVPIRTRKRSHKQHIYYAIDADAVNGLDNDSTVDCTQIRAVDKSRFGKVIGNATKEQLEAILKVIILNLS
jgi:mRNA interferase MazF